jgi:hypothetical protein
LRTTTLQRMNLLLSPGLEPKSQKRIGGGWALKSRKSLNGVPYPILKRGARSNFWKIWQREVRLLILAHLSSWKISSFPTYPRENHLLPNISSEPQYRQLESTVAEVALHQRQILFDSCKTILVNKSSKLAKSWKQAAIDWLNFFFGVVNFSAISSWNCFRHPTLWMGQKIEIWMQQ